MLLYEYLLSSISLPQRNYCSGPFLERNLNPKAACLKRREEEKVEEEAPEKRAVPGVDKPFDTTGAAAAGRGRGRRGRRSSRGGWVFILVANLFLKSIFFGVS